MFPCINYLIKVKNFNYKVKLTLGGFVVSYFEKGNELYNVKDYKKAITFYKKAIENRENEACSYYNAAVCFIKLKEYPRALDLIKSALSLKQESKYFFNLAYCYAMLNDTQKALIYFNTAWALDNNDKDCEKAINLITKNLKKGACK